MTAQRSLTVGLVLAVVQLVAAVVLAALGLAVRAQGLPQDFDTVSTVSGEALLLHRLAVFGAVPLLAVFLTSAVLLVRARIESRLWAGMGAVLLSVGLLLGAVGYIVWGRMGW